MRTLLLALALAAVVSAQAPPAGTFEVAAIRENTSGAAGGGSRFQEGGRWLVTNVSVVGLVLQAYGLSDYARILGAPDWAHATRYDINALGTPGFTIQQIPTALQALLRDRFQLSARTQQRELPVYNLVVSNNGRLGPGMRPAAVNCNDPAARQRAIAAATTTIPCGIRYTNAGTIIDAGGVTLESVTGILTGPAGRPVIDKTGLSGLFDIQLRHSGPGPDTANADAVSIFTAVQEQLGLRLENATASLDVVVIDRVERPSEN